jgi:hypothetical protein
VTTTGRGRSHGLGCIGIAGATASPGDGHRLSSAGWRVNVETVEGSCHTAVGERRTLHVDDAVAHRADTVADTFPLAPGARRCYRVVVHDGSYPTLGPAFVATLTYQAA